MRHVRQALLTIAIVLAMYLLPGQATPLLSQLVPVEYFALVIWLDRLVFFLCGVVAGALLQRLLTWRLRWLAMLALPVLVLLVVPNIAYLRARTIIQGDISYVAMWPYYVYLGIPIVGMIVGGLLVARKGATA
jgi:hypothetical protein